MISAYPTLLKLRQLKESPTFTFWKECRKIWDTVEDGGAKLKTMVSSGRKVRSSAFAREVDLKSYSGLRGYPEGIEGLEEFLRDDPGSGLFKSTFDSRPCYFIKHHGFETVFLSPST